MPLTPEETQTMRGIIAGLLEIDSKRVTPEANYFRDLGGTFGQLKPLRLKTGKAFKVDITAITDEVNARTGMKNGLVTAKSLKAIGEYLGLNLGRKPIVFLDLYTVAFIEAITAKAIEQRDGKKRPGGKAAAPAVRFSPTSRSADVRQVVGRVLNISADQLSADTELGKVEGLLLAGVFMELDARWGTKIGSAVEEIIAACRYDAKGNLTKGSRRKLAELLPSVEFPASATINSSFLDRLGMLEAIVERDGAAEPRLANRPIFRLPVGAKWTDKQSRPLASLQESLGDRKALHVLAECCRLAKGPKKPWSPLVDQCVEALVRYSTTGRGKKDLKELARDLEDWELEGDPVLRALAAAMRPEVPRDLLVSAAKAIAVAENLDQKQAVERVQAVAASLAEEAPQADEKTARRGKRKSLLSQLPKSAQRDLPEVLQRCGNRSLKEYIGWQWHFEQQLDAERLKSFRQAASDNRGELSEEQWFTGRRFRFAYDSLADLAVARRFCLEDPAEILLGLSLAGRIGWMHQGNTSRSYDDPLLGALAVGDVAVAERYAETLPPWDPDGESDFDLRSDGVVAVLRGEYELLKTALDRDIHLSKVAWYQSMIDFYRGIIDRDPGQTTAALQRFFAAMKRLRDKIRIEFAFCPMTHGFYRLAESISPKLVAGFDVSQKFPWDAEVHECVHRGLRPWKDFDLSDVSPELHAAVTTLSRPIWWT